MKTITKSIEMLRSELKAAGIKFRGNLGLVKLQELAQANGIETEMKARSSIVPNHYKEKYGSAGNCGDELAAVLAEVSQVDGKASYSRLMDIAKQNGIDFSRWAHLNIGQQRMNLSNVLRGKLKRGEQVEVGDHKFSAAA